MPGSPSPGPALASGSYKAILSTEGVVQPVRRLSRLGQALCQSQRQKQETLVSEVPPAEFLQNPTARQKQHWSPGSAAWGLGSSSFGLLGQPPSLPQSWEPAEIPTEIGIKAGRSSARNELSNSTSKAGRGAQLLLLQSHQPASLPLSPATELCNSPASSFCFLNAFKDKKKQHNYSL